ncbi:MAG: hypothetical protein K0B11_09890 [Mariniphaga sp.]|nr:hypothetical protein [Mariniphaga sp.]
MKTLMYFLVLAILVIAGCAKDDTMFENQNNLELKKAKVPIPFKYDAYVVWDEESDLVLIEGLDPNDPASYAYSKLICSGTATHMGKINSEKSFYTLEKLVLFFEDGIPYTRNTGKGILVGANGDGFEFSFTVVQNAIDKTCNGINEIIPGTGTGKLEGYTGTIFMSGGLVEDRSMFLFECEGYLVYE